MNSRRAAHANMRHRASRTVCLACACAVLTGAAACAPRSTRTATPTAVTTSATPTSPTLKSVFQNDFMVGAALNPAQFGTGDALGTAITTSQFNTISPENVLKWELVHPAMGRYDFGPSDAYVAFGERYGMFVVGHTLVWHSQVPRWVFQDASGAQVSRDTLLGRMREHIQTVMGRYKGRIKGWDVVNEALEEDGTLRKSPWLNIIGEDFIAKAFEYAHEVDPAAELYYNDYSLENPAKREGAVKLIKSLKARGIPIHAIGMQGHMKMDWPSIGLEDSTIAMFAATGVKVNVTELDVDVLPPATTNRGADVGLRATGGASIDPYAAALPDSVSRALAKRYADLFDVYLRHRDAIDRITFWGVADGDSWLNSWPVRGRTSYPLIFDRQHRAKAAFDAIMARGRAPRPVTAKPIGEQQ